jgi:uncharacterized NAD-dependent epimerase/dehydratase family protein
MLENRRILLLTDGHLGVFSSKTAVSILRYRARDVVAILDRAAAGRDPAEIVGVGAGIPIVGSVEEALPYEPRSLLIGIAPPGGGLPEDWRGFLREAIERGLDILSGLHVMIADDPELGPLARARGVAIADVRRPPDAIPLGANLARTLPVTRVLTVGSDCNCGKMVAAIEIADELERRGRRARFLATGQTGILLSGYGIAVDRVISDFVAGAVEKLLLENQHHEAVLIEGQGSLYHPAYSGVTLSLMHGSAPHALVLCHQATRRTLRRHDEVPIPPLSEIIDLHERIMAPLFPSKVVGIALNCVDLSDESARDAVDRAAAQTGLPATDVIRFGAGPLADVIEGILRGRASAENEG